jgi:hypothetical protein
MKNDQTVGQEKIDDAYDQHRGVRERLRQSESTAARKDQFNVALEFLKKLRPRGPWVLTAIKPDGPAMTITAHRKDEVHDFIAKHDGRNNLYYSVNPTKAAVTRKATKADIAAVEFIHADLDPREDETPKRRSVGTGSP